MFPPAEMAVCNHRPQPTVPPERLPGMVGRPGWLDASEDRCIRNGRPGSVVPPAPEQGAASAEAAFAPGPASAARAPGAPVVGWMLLRPSAIKLLETLRSVGGKGQVKREALARLTGLGRRTIDAAAQELVALGWLSWDGQRGQGICWQLLPAPVGPYSRS